MGIGNRDLAGAGLDGNGTSDFARKRATYVSTTADVLWYKYCANVTELSLEKYFEVTSKASLHAANRKRWLGVLRVFQQRLLLGTGNLCRVLKVLQNLQKIAVRYQVCYRTLTGIWEYCGWAVTETFCRIADVLQILSELLCRVPKPPQYSQKCDGIVIGCHRRFCRVPDPHRTFLFVSELLRKESPPVSPYVSNICTVHEQTTVGCTSRLTQTKAECNNINAFAFTISSRYPVYVCGDCLALIV